MATHGSLKFQELPTGRAARSGVSLLQARSANSRQMRFMATWVASLSGLMAISGSLTVVFLKAVKLALLLPLAGSKSFLFLPLLLILSLSRPGLMAISGSLMGFPLKLPEYNASLQLGP